MQGNEVVYNRPYYLVGQAVHDFGYLGCHRRSIDSEVDNTILDAAVPMQQGEELNLPFFFFLSVC